MSVEKPVQHERFMRLFVEHERELLRYALAVVPHLPDARDIVQETAVALWRKMAEYDPARPFLPWACRFASIEIRRFLRRADQQRRLKAEGKSWHIHWAATDLTPDRLGAWTLLASVVDGARREVVHYVNGREVARRPATLESPFALMRLCLGNLSSTEAEAKAGIRYGFFGRMDEVIVANRAFGSEEIQRLYASGKP